MFRKEVKPIEEVMLGVLRMQGLEAPLLQRRLIAAVDEVLPHAALRYLGERYIRNQTLFVRVSSPVVRAELSMSRTVFVHQLNAKVGAMVITDIRFC